MNRAKVGQIVHLYSDALACSYGHGINGQGAGPYAAIVTQAFDGQYVNLTVMVPFADAKHEGSVSHLDDSYKDATGHSSRYYVEIPADADAPQA